MSSLSMKKLKQMGYKLKVDQNEIHYQGPNRLWTNEEKKVIRACLHDLKSKKDQVLEELGNADQLRDKKVIAVDIETTGLDPFTDRIRMAAWSDGAVVQSSENVNDFCKLFEDEAILKVFHNATFDVQFLLTHGFDVRNYTDTLIMSQVINNKVSQENSLDLLIFRYLGKQMDKQFQHSDQWQGELTEQHFKYCEQDAKLTKQLYDVLREEVKQVGRVNVLQREINVLPAIAELQQTGVPFNFEGWEAELHDMVAERRLIVEEIGSTFNSTSLNINSPKQLKGALETAGIKVSGTSDEVLSKHEGAHPVIPLIRKYKKIQKRLTAYGDKFKMQINEDGRIRGKWRIIGTNTGRMSCTKPNLQGLPTVAKKYVEAPEGFTFIVADYSQIELRVVAQLSKDKAMMESYQNNEDLHQKTAALILGKSIDEVSPDERRIAKTTNFGLLYGMTTYGLRKRIRATCGLDVTFEMASTFRDGFFQLYEGIRSYQDRLLKTSSISTAGGRGWTVHDIPLGKIQRLNYPIQSTAAEGLKETLALLMQEKCEKWRLMAVVHDEIILEVPIEEAEQAATMLENCMIKGMKYFVPDVPIIVDIEARRKWKV